MVAPKGTPFAFRSLVDRAWVRKLGQFLRMGVSGRSAPRDIHVAIDGTARSAMPGLDDFALRRPWLVRLAIGSSCVALVAESSAEPTYAFRGPPVHATAVLDAEVPTRVYRIAFRAQRLGPDEVQTTHGASTDYAGSIEREGRRSEATAPLIEFTVVRADMPDGGRPSVSTSVFTSIKESASLVFEGDCEKFEAAPCEAVVLVSFSRADDGAAGGTVTIDWTLTSRSAPSGDFEPDGGVLQAPWTVSVEEQ